MASSNPNPTLHPPPPPPSMPRSDSGSRRQHFSCAECRRLKLKCSRHWPCTNCVKRGIPQICPDGQVKRKEGKQWILANTEELHARIQALELALSQERAKTSEKPHPLLLDEYDFSSVHRREDIDDVVEGKMGQLKISEGGQAHYVGGYAGSQYLRGEDESGPSTPVEFGAAPPPRTYDTLYDGVIGGLPSGEWTVYTLREHLPDYETEGANLLACYWSNVNWMYQAVPRRMFEIDHLPNAYSDDPQPHKLACVFFMMAIGVIFDLHREAWSPRSQQLFYFARLSLGLLTLDHASPATVQALHLMGTYIMNDNLGNSADVFWPILGAAVKVAQSLGLHRDGTQFAGLSELEIQERRVVYWEILTYDRLQSMCFSRPSALTNRCSDTKLPDPGLFDDPDGFHCAKYRLMQMMERVIDIQTQTSGVLYSACAKLDGELLDFRKTLPQSLMPDKPILELPLDKMTPPQTIIHRLSIRFLVSQTRLLLNRHWFALAIDQRPDDPAASKFGGAFMAVFESCSDIVTIIKQLVLWHPSLIARWWFFWFHALSAATCLAMVAIRAPGSAYASPAFASLAHLCSIASASRSGCRARNGLPSLQYLKARAQEAIASATKPSYHKTEDDPEMDTYFDHVKLTSRLVRLSSPANRVSASPSMDRSSPDVGNIKSDFSPAPLYNVHNGHGHSQPDVPFPANWISSLWPPAEGSSNGNGNGVPHVPYTLPVDHDTSMAFGMNVPPMDFGFGVQGFRSGGGGAGAGGEYRQDGGEYRQ